MSNLRDILEVRQVGIYFAAVIFAALIAFLIPGTTALEMAINPALAFMLFVTFLQVPVAELGRAFLQMRFLGALLVTNFIAVPALVFGLIQFLPADPLIRLGVLLVLLTPCIDYVVTFAHMGRGDARLLLAATPTLLIVQMLALPFYLGAFLGDEASGLVQMGPFIHAFVWLIALPLIGAALVQIAAAKLPAMRKVAVGLGLLPVPATALVLFVVVAAVVPQLGMSLDGALQVLPIYIAFAALAPAIGWVIARIARIEVGGARAVAFSAATRNSLVVLPLAFAVPNAMPLLPAIIVTQTLVELVSEMVYVRVIASLGPKSADVST
ncbi:arsenic resistance protein [Agrobacterium tumefaciens]|nr:arsenic resistance protein [Agrobacterium tumefaciens]TQN54810.1 arsenic resistance protein [Agrobacterium tumefaciens]